MIALGWFVSFPSAQQGAAVVIQYSIVLTLVSKNCSNCFSLLTKIHTRNETVEALFLSSLTDLQSGSRHAAGSALRARRMTFWDASDDGDKNHHQPRRKCSSHDGSEDWLVRIRIPRSSTLVGRGNKKILDMFVYTFLRFRLSKAPKKSLGPATRAWMMTEYRSIPAHKTLNFGTLESAQISYGFKTSICQRILLDRTRREKLIPTIERRLWLIQSNPWMKFRAGWMA